MKDKTTIIHILRNPYGHSQDAQKTARLAAADLLDCAAADAALTATIKQRDRAQRFADELAAQIAAITGAGIGEHSSSNNPWQQAILAADDFLASPQPTQNPVPATDESGGVTAPDRRTDAEIIERAKFDWNLTQPSWNCWDNLTERDHLKLVISATRATPAQSVPLGGGERKPIEIPCDELTAQQAAKLTWNINAELQGREIDLWVGVMGTKPGFLHPQDGKDAERLDWLMLHLGGRELRDLGIHTDAGCDRQAIDAAILASTKGSA